MCYCPMCMTDEDEMECMYTCPTCGEPLEEGSVEDD
jgi:hypothetical protein